MAGAYDSPASSYGRGRGGRGGAGGYSDTANENRNMGSHSIIGGGIESGLTFKNRANQRQDDFVIPTTTNYGGVRIEKKVNISLLYLLIYIY